MPSRHRSSHDLQSPPSRRGGITTLLFALGVAVLLSACSQHSLPTATAAPPDASVAPVSGFLGDYSDLSPGLQEDLLLVYRKEEDVLAAYDAFLIEPVLVFFDPSTGGGGVEPGELEELASFLRDRGVEELEDAGFEIATEPGPRVARVRAAITQVKPIRPGRNLGSKAAGMTVGIGLLVPSVDVGHAAIEVEILDATSGERLVAVVASREGRRFFNLRNSSKRWGDTKAALAKWAKEFRRRLEELHGRSGK